MPAALHYSTKQPTNRRAPLPSAPSALSYQAIPLLKDSIKKAYGKKGDKIVNMNW